MKEKGAMVVGTETIDFKEIRDSQRNIIKACRRSIQGKDKEVAQLFVIQTLESSYDNMKLSVNESLSTEDRFSHAEVGRKENVEAWKYVNTISNQNERVKIDKALNDKLFKNSGSFVQIKKQILNNQENWINKDVLELPLMSKTNKFFLETSKLRIVLVLLFILCGLWFVLTITFPDTFSIDPNQFNTLLGLLK